MGIVMRLAVARWLPLLALLAVLVFGAAAGGAAAIPTADGAGEDVPTTTMRIAIQPSGDARWNVTVRFVLDSANETRGFDRLATAFEAGDADVLSVDPFRTAATRAGRTTGRTMGIRDVSRRAVRSDGVGRLTLSFRWTRFARVTDERVEFGDAFRTPSGTWLPRLAANQELVVDFPDGYAPVSTSHQLTNGTFHLEGPTTLGVGEPSATLVRQPSRRVTTTTAGDGETATLSPRETPIEALTRVFGVGAVIVVIVALAVLVYRRRDDLPTTTDGKATAEPAPDDDAPPAEPSTDDPAEPLLSDEERVLRLLRENDGRMKQAAIVTETDWSNAKVSQLLSEMDERDQIDKLRIGRENLISLPDETPEEFE